MGFGNANYVGTLSTTLNVAYVHCTPSFLYLRANITPPLVLTRKTSNSVYNELHYCLLDDDAHSKYDKASC